MAALPEPLLMTVEEFNALPEETGEFYYELHFGELVEVSRAKWKHSLTQTRLREAFLRILEPHKWFVEIELSFSISPEYDLRGADVGVLSRSRMEAIDPEGYLQGAPEIVVEIKSRYNTRSSLRMRAAVCLMNGAEQFWVADPDKRTVLVTTRAVSLIYSADQSIPVFGATLELSQIFH